MTSARTRLDVSVIDTSVPTLDDKIDENYRVFYIADRPEVGHVHMLFAISTANYWL